MSLLSKVGVMQPTRTGCNAQRAVRYDVTYREWRKVSLKLEHSDFLLMLGLFYQLKRFFYAALSQIRSRVEFGRRSLSAHAMSAPE